MSFTEKELDEMLRTDIKNTFRITFMKSSWNNILLHLTKLTKLIKNILVAHNQNLIYKISYRRIKKLVVLIRRELNIYNYYADDQLTIKDILASVCADQKTLDALQKTFQIIK